MGIIADTHTILTAQSTSLGTVNTQLDAATTDKLQAIINKLTLALNDSQLPRSFYDAYVPTINEAIALIRATQALELQSALSNNTDVSNNIDLLLEP